MSHYLLVKSVYEAMKLCSWLKSRVYSFQHITILLCARLLYSWCHCLLTLYPFPSSYCHCHCHYHQGSHGTVHSTIGLWWQSWYETWSVNGEMWRHHNHHFCHSANTTLVTGMGCMMLRYLHKPTGFCFMITLFLKFFNTSCLFTQCALKFLYAIGLPLTFTLCWERCEDQAESVKLHSPCCFACSKPLVLW